MSTLGSLPDTHVIRLLLAQAGLCLVVVLMGVAVGFAVSGRRSGPPRQRQRQKRG